MSEVSAYQAMLDLLRKDQVVILSAIKNTLSIAQKLTEHQNLFFSFMRKKIGFFV